MNFKKNNFNIINEIINSIDIVSYIGTKINIIRNNNYYYSICPFHKEKKASFFINKKYKFYYCFGCKSKGNIFNFLMNFENISFKESIKKIVYENNLNIKINHLYKNKNKKNNIFINIFRKVSYIYNKNFFFNLKFNKNIKKYIIDKKWKSNTIKNFLIGYSNNNSLLFFKKYFNKKILLYLNILNIDKNNNIKDKFLNRIIFPIKNEYEEIIGFGGKFLFDNKNISKYINSKNNFLFNKSDILYGLDIIIKNYKKENIERLILVEGYTDVISLYNYNILNSISTLGTSISKKQIEKIFKYTNNIIICYDNDETGRKSCINTFKKILPYITDDRQINVVILPLNEDPDSLIKKIGKKKFELLLDNSFNIYSFIKKIILDNNKINLNNIYYKIFFLKKFLFLIKEIPSKLYILFLKKKIYYDLNINFNNNFLEIKNNENIIINNNIIKVNKYNPIHIGIYFILKKPYLYKKINFYIKNFNFNNKNITIFLKIINICKKYNICNKNYLFTFFKNKKNLYYFNKIMEVYKDIKIDNNNIFINVIKKIYIIILENIQKFLILKYKNNELNNKQNITLLYTVKKIYELKNIN